MAHATLWESPHWNYRALGVAIALCLAVAALEGMLGADGVLTWYPTLKKPDWHLPMAAFIAIGMLVYLIREEKGEM